jgi:hypothetical protein
MSFIIKEGNTASLLQSGFVTPGRTTFGNLSNEDDIIKMYLERTNGYLTAGDFVSWGKMLPTLFDIIWRIKIVLPLNELFYKRKN